MMSKSTSEKIVNNRKLQKLDKRLFMSKSERSTVSLWVTELVHVHNSFFPVLHTYICKTSPVDSTVNFSQINVKICTDVVSPEIVPLKF